MVHDALDGGSSGISTLPVTVSAAADPSSAATPQPNGTSTPASNDLNKPKSTSNGTATSRNGRIQNGKGVPLKLTPEEEEAIWAKRRERAEKRLRDIKELNSEPIDKNAKVVPGRLGFKQRQLYSFGLPVRGKRISVMTWNILAQCLVKRELFPGSDLLRWKDRGPIPMREVAHYRPDIVCLQEVDRLSDHEPALAEAGYHVRWENGYVDKLHGLLIGWKSSVFKRCGEHVAKMDDLAFTSEPDRTDGQKGSKRTGLSRVTRNIGLALALGFVDDPSKGVIVATHHLFWHAKHMHERARQTGLWLRDVRAFRNSRPEWKSWPLLFCGDFNTQPFEPCYRLLVGAPLLPRHRALLNHSRVVHSTVDSRTRDEVSCPFPPPPPAAEPDENENEGSANPMYSDEAGDADQALKSCRPATDADQLLTTEEIASLYADEATGRPLGLRSVYGSDYGRLRSEFKVECFDGRAPDEGIDENVFDGATGADEPRWTSVTPLWRCTLDYIFVLPGENGTDASTLNTTALLPMHDTLFLEPGLPAVDKEPSDHLSLLAELSYEPVAA